LSGRGAAAAFLSTTAAALAAAEQGVGEGMGEGMGGAAYSSSKALPCRRRRAECTYMRSPRRHPDISRP